MTKPRSAIPALFIALPLSACGGVGDASLGPDPGGGFYDGGNINVGQIDPQQSGYFIAGEPAPWLR
jgi:hypothetical protein